MTEIELFHRYDQDYSGFDFILLLRYLKLDEYWCVY